jgi:hypothetical protein
MMFWCAEEFQEVIDRSKELGSFEDTPPSQLSYGLLTLSTDPEAGSKEASEFIARRLASSQNSPIGVLGIPIGAYVDLSYALSRQDLSLTTILEVLLPFLVPYSTAIRRCMKDQYHWKRLAFPFHPAEPDVLSVLFCVEAALREQKQSFSTFEILKSVPLFPVATDILYNAILERFDVIEH